MRVNSPKKLFGRDIGMRSTFVKYDPCVTGTRPTLECDDSMVSLISDRFLGEKFEKEILSKKYERTKNLFTYVLIADTIGCNLNCWFCYAWKYLNIRDAKKIQTCFLNAKALAKQFDCKIRKTADLEYMKEQVHKKDKFSADEKNKIIKHLELELPFSRIRISGGEPIFSNGDVFQTNNESDGLIIQTIRYWVDFFEELDALVDKTKREGLINIATFDSEWQDLPHPVWLTEAKDRIMVRFDTNGIIFGSEKLARFFYSELFRLLNQGKLQNLHVQIDYSFKGATRKEFMWSQSKNLPTTLANNDEELVLDKHPQAKGFNNIISNIDELGSRNSDFKEAVSITVEKGIDHDWEKSKLWLYYPKALEWEKLAAGLSIEFSDVVNYFDLNFGWHLNAKLHRYTKRGAMIELINGLEKVDVTSASFSDLRTFRKQNVKSENYMTLVYPVGDKVELFPRKPAKLLSVPEVDVEESDQNFWIITGSTENMLIGLEHGLWGVKSGLKSLWDRLKEEDRVYFYCTKPVSGIVGYGEVTSKHVDDKPFWPNESPERSSRYPLRIKFRTVFVAKNWQSEKFSLFRTGIEFYHGLNYVDPGKKDLLLGFR